MADIRFAPQVVMVPGERPRPGAVPGPGGKYAEEDMEVFVSVCLPAMRGGGLVDAVGRRAAVPVPIVTLSRPRGEFMGHAEVLLSAAEVGGGE